MAFLVGKPSSHIQTVTRRRENWSPPTSRSDIVRGRCGLPGLVIGDAGTGVNYRTVTTKGENELQNTNPMPKTYAVRGGVGWCGHIGSGLEHVLVLAGLLVTGRGRVAAVLLAVGAVRVLRLGQIRAEPGRRAGRGHVGRGTRRVLGRVLGGRHDLERRLRVAGLERAGHAAVADRDHEQQRDGEEHLEAAQRRRVLGEVGVDGHRDAVQRVQRRRGLVEPRLRALAERPVRAAGHVNHGSRAPSGARTWRAAARAARGRSPPARACGRGWKAWCGRAPSP